MLILPLIAIALSILTLPTFAATTEVTITKLANDGVTVLGQVTVNYTWMEANLPVLGDGATNYSHQGPTFNESDLWNPNEDTNLQKVLGVNVSGTNVKDLCNLVGGMSSGEEVRISAPDGFNKWFNYTNVYEPQPRQGPMVITWKSDGKYPDTGYAEGMRLFFFADNSTNLNRWHVFGDWDMHESLSEKYWHYNGIYPAASGLSVQSVSNITIYSDDPAPPVMDVLFNGTVILTPGEIFNVTAYNSGKNYTINRTTPFGALDVAATTAGFTYDVTDSRWIYDQVLLLDNVDGYLYNKSLKWNWLAYVNDVYKDGYQNHPDGLNVIELSDGDRVEFYYVQGAVDKTNLTAIKAVAHAAVKIVASIGTTPTNWTLALSGARDETVTKAYFEQAIQCQPTHNVTWTDGEGNVWGGMPLWLLVAMVDDDPDPGAPYHYNFNDSLAAQGYQVKVIANDGYFATLESTDIARNNGYIVANTLNGEPLPLTLGEPQKVSWPLHLKGPAVTGGNQVGGIVRIELIGLPKPPAGWVLKLVGDVGDTITQSEFEEAVACGHNATYTDSSNNVWTGIPLWYLVGAVDDSERTGHWTFNDSRAAMNYSVQVIAPDGYTRTFYSDLFARSDGYIVANTMNGSELPPEYYPLRLVGRAITSNKDRVSKITEISIPMFQTPPPEPGSYNLNLTGKITDVLSQAEFEAAANCPVHHTETTVTDKYGNTYIYSGIPLWYLCGWIDDRIPHGPEAFNDNQAAAGYKIIVKAVDGYAKDFQSADVARSSDYIVANMKSSDGGETFAPLGPDEWPLRLVGPGAKGGYSVSQISDIILTDFGEPVEIPKLHIVKYGDDGITIIAETTIDYLYMKENFTVIGNGVTVYKFQGITNDPEDIWSPTNETKGGFKIQNAVKGTRVRDLVSLVGGMGADTDIIFVGSDGFTSILPYTSIYPTPEIQAHQGDAIIAWFADGQYVPQYKDGMRLFFMPDDHIYGQWDMHESMDPGYWTYFYQTYPPSSPYSPGVLFPSCAQLSAKYVTKIKVYSKPEKKWNLTVDGTGIGGINYTFSKAYFERALTCQFGANHSADYTDSEGTWTGMPLWFLCGYVDDADMHSNNAYNETLAMEGYDIVVIGSNGSSTIIDSRNTIQNANYIVANTLNGFHIPEIDSSWPLRLVGMNVSGEQSIKGVNRIVLSPRLRLSITTDAFRYTKRDKMTITVDIANPTEDMLRFQWYWGVPQYNYWKLVKSGSIPAGYDNTTELSLTIPNLGSKPFGNVFYVQLLNATGEKFEKPSKPSKTSPKIFIEEKGEKGKSKFSGEVIAADAACWAYTPGGKAVPQVDISKEIDKTIERIG